MTPFVDATALKTSAALLCDVRWYPDGRSGRTAYEEGHVPGAIYVDLAADLAGPAVTADGKPAGQCPLPAPETFANAMSRLGIDGQRPVIAYDDVGGMAAARLVWMLRVTGHDAAVLDGGLSGWAGVMERGPCKSRTPAEFKPKPYPDSRLATLDDVRSQVGAGGLLIDAGTAARYRGESLSIHTKAGHIPGALSMTWSGSLDDASRKLLSIDALRSRFQSFGIFNNRDVIAYCGSGIAACHLLLAMEQARIGSGRLFPGSWSQWSADLDRPIATGTEPGAM